MNTKIKEKVCFLTCLTLFIALPSSALASVTLGGENGNVTLINPDNSTFVYVNGNLTTYSYIGNAPDGWWNLYGVEENELWVIGVVLGLIAIALAVALAVKKRNNE